MVSPPGPVTVLSRAASIGRAVPGGQRLRRQRGPSELGHDAVAEDGEGVLQRQVRLGQREAQVDERAGRPQHPARAAGRPRPPRATRPSAPRGAAPRRMATPDRSTSASSGSSVRTSVGGRLLDAAGDRHSRRTGGRGDGQERRLGVGRDVDPVVDGEVGVGRRHRVSPSGSPPPPGSPPAARPEAGPRGRRRARRGGAGWAPPRRRGRPTSSRSSPSRNACTRSPGRAGRPRRRPTRRRRPSPRGSTAVAPSTSSRSVCVASGPPVLATVTKARRPPVAGSTD